MRGIWIFAAFAATGLAGCATTPGAATAPKTTVALPQVGDSYFTAGAARIDALSTGARAKNVILFVGDGMGHTTVTAARIFAGQQAGKDGESNALTMDTFPNVAFSRTYSHDMQIAESAATATAMTTGVKTSGGGLGLTAGAGRGKCEDTAAHMAKSLWEAAGERGMGVGVVSTARLTHATPAATFAHTPDRNWENDMMTMRAKAEACPDIARQLIEWPYAGGMDVAMGGGRLNFLPREMKDPRVANLPGQRLDKRDLTAEWAAKPNHAYVWNSGQLAALGDAKGQKVLGLFNTSHMSYDSKRSKAADGEPSLKDMTTFAIRRLQQNENGYLLMVEAGRIDHAHHEGKAGEALSETVAFDEAIAAALAMTSRKDTLILVTADHSHTLTMSGYAKRGTPILGLSTDPDGNPVKAADGKPYTTLGYANGPGSVYGADGQTAASGRPDPSTMDLKSLDTRQQSLVPMESETHGGEDVPLYAWGPNDSAVRGTLEQNVIFHVMADTLGFEFKPAQKK